MAEMGARERILGDIRGALRRDRNPTSVPGESPASASSQLSVSDIEKNCNARRDELIAQLESESTRIGARFHKAATADAAFQYVEQVASARQAKTVVSWDAPLFDSLDLSARLAQKGIVCCKEMTDAELVPKAAAADIGLSGVDYALADTGTLVLLAGNGRARSISLLPPVHIAVVRPHQVLSGLSDLFPILRRDASMSGETLSSAITFITGPSRTADIELTLVVGVHGPQELHVLLFD